MAKYQRKIRPEPKSLHVITDEIRQKPFKPATFPRVCLVCSTSYNYRPAGKDKGHEDKRGLFCSWDCKSKYLAERKPPKFSKIYAGYCEYCTKPFVGRFERPHCSTACKPKVAVKKEPVTATRKCNTCDKEYQFVRTNGRPFEYCSVECKEVVVSAQRRIFKAKRKALLKKVTVENVDPFTVFDRDGWQCKMCGIETPKHKRGSWEDDAPELDHVLPLSKGGEHSYENTQCSCRKCNLKKSDNILHDISSVAKKFIYVGVGHLQTSERCLNKGPLPASFRTTAKNEPGVKSRRSGVNNYDFRAQTDAKRAQARQGQSRQARLEKKGGCCRHS